MAVESTKRPVPWEEKRVPDEVLCGCLLMADIQGLCLSERVCRTWRRCGGDLLLWKEIAAQRFGLSTLPPAFENWKEAVLAQKALRGRHYSTHAYHISHIVCCILLRGPYLVSGYVEMGSVIDVRNLDTNYLHFLKGHKDGVTCLQLEGMTLYSGSYDGTVRMWDIEALECLGIFAQDLGIVNSLQV